MNIVIRGGLVFTQNARRELVRADVLIRDGRIDAVGTVAEQESARVIDARGKWVLPGFVQAHMHLTQTLFRGLADDRELLPWLRDRIWPLEAAHTPESNYVAAELGIAELLLSGTTAILDMGTTYHHDAVFEAARDFGIRYFGGKALMDQGEGVPPKMMEAMEPALRGCDAQLKRWHRSSNGRLRFVYAPRFILSCSDPLLRAVGERSRADAVLIHTHSSENQGEIGVVRQIAGAANLRALEARGCLHEHTVIAHGVWVEGDEEECLVASGAALCHCPGSNLKLASGISPVPRLLGRGVRIGLGADGAACNNTLDQRYEMRLASVLHRLNGGPNALSAQQVLDLATLGGAAALGMAREIGSIEVGKRADIVCFEPSVPLQPVKDPVSALVYGATSAAVTDVIVDGVQRVAGGLALDIDMRTLPARAAAARDALVIRAAL
jgi:5-methylthioadenosine/S-adenosylhomocysteine deaminase